MFTLKSLSPARSSLTIPSPSSRTHPSSAPNSCTDQAIPLASPSSSIGRSPSFEKASYFPPTPTTAASSKRAQGAGKRITRDEALRAVRAMEDVLGAWNEYRISIASTGKAGRKLGAALEDLAGCMDKTEVAAQTMRPTATLLDGISEMTMKLAKKIDKEYDEANSDASKYFTLLAKESRTHDAYLGAIGKKHDKAEKAYRKAAKSLSDTSGAHTGLLAMKDSLSDDIARAQEDHHVLIGTKQTSILLKLASSSGALAVNLLSYFSDGLRKAGTSFPDIEYFHSLADAKWQSSLPPSLDDEEEEAQRRDQIRLIKARVALGEHETVGRAVWDGLKISSRDKSGSEEITSTDMTPLALLANTPRRDGSSPVQVLGEPSHGTSGQSAGLETGGSMTSNGKLDKHQLGSMSSTTSSDLASPVDRESKGSTGQRATAAQHIIRSPGVLVPSLDKDKKTKASELRFGLSTAPAPRSSGPGPFSSPPRTFTSVSQSAAMSDPLGGGPGVSTPTNMSVPDANAEKALRIHPAERATSRYEDLPSGTGTGTIQRHYDSKVRSIAMARSPGLSPSGSGAGAEAGAGATPSEPGKEHPFVYGDRPPPIPLHPGSRRSVSHLASQMETRSERNSSQPPVHQIRAVSHDQTHSQSQVQRQMQSEIQRRLPEVARGPGPDQGQGGSHSEGGVQRPNYNQDRYYSFDNTQFHTQHQVDGTQDQEGPEQTSDPRINGQQSQSQDQSASGHQRQRQQAFEMHQSHTSFQRGCELCAIDYERMLSTQNSLPNISADTSLILANMYEAAPRNTRRVTMPPQHSSSASSAIDDFSLQRAPASRAYEAHSVHLQAEGKRQDAAGHHPYEDEYETESEKMIERGGGHGPVNKRHHENRDDHLYHIGNKSFRGLNDEIPSDYLGSGSEWPRGSHGGLQAATQMYAPQPRRAVGMSPELEMKAERPSYGT